MNERLRKLSFRASHRGLKELDLILGRFAEAHLADMNEAELDQFEQLLDTPDPQVLAWVMGTESLPEDQTGTVITRIKQFRLTPADYASPR